MRWPAAVLAQVVLDAGLSGDDAVTAVALALASSGGDDAMVIYAPTGGRPMFRGAWALPADWANGTTGARTSILATDAATVAAWLGVHPGDWSWSPVYVAGRHEPYLDAARTALANPQPGVDSPGVDQLGNVDGGVAELEDWAGRVHNAVGNVGRSAPPAPNPWR